MTLDPDAPYLGARRARRGRRAVYAGLGLLAVLVTAALVAALVSVPYYAITPGAGLDVAPLISVPRAAATDHRGSVLLTDVELVPLRALTYLWYRIDPNVQIVPASALVGPLSAAQYDAQGVVDMATARQAATYAGLRALGYPVRAEPAGPVVYQPVPGAPAARSLQIGDVITELGGAPVRSFASLVAAVEAHRPGATVAVVSHPIGGGATRTRRVVLGEVFGSASAPACLAAGASTRLAPLRLNGATRPCLGFAFEQTYRTAGAPFTVRISSRGIIGPSAGLAFTLGLIEKLDRADLTGGRRIAATGTMAIDGSVGDVGGVAQKTIAVRDAGATVFFVPKVEYATARAHAGSHLKIVAVSSLGDALAALRRLGGRLVPAGNAGRP